MKAYKKFYRPTHGGLRYILIIIFGIALLATVLASLVPQEAIKPYVRHSDKVLHFCVYLAVSFLALGAFPKRKLIIIFLGLSLIGVIIELLQANMGLGRTASAGDILANCLGVAVPILIWIAVILKNRVQ